MSRGKTVPGFSLNSFVAPKEDWYKTLTFQDSIDMAKEKMVSTAENFVALGYSLKHIRDKELYKDKGYNNIWECANSELGLTQSTASRYINICEKFSTDGDSPYLDTKYKEYGKSQLQELLAINDQKLLEQITPDMSVKQIQKLKKSNKVKKDDEQPIQPTEKQIPEDTYEALPGQMQVVVDGTFRELSVDKEAAIESVNNTTESDTSEETNDIDVPGDKISTNSDIKVTETMSKTVVAEGGYDMELICKLIKKYKGYAEDAKKEGVWNLFHEWNCLLDALELLKEKLLTIDG